MPFQKTKFSKVYGEGGGGGVWECPGENLPIFKLQGLESLMTSTCINRIRSLPLFLEVNANFSNSRLFKSSQFLLTLISASLIKWRVNFRDLNFRYFRPKFSIHSRKQKSIILSG